MFAQGLICSWIGVFGLTAGAFGQTYVGVDVAGPCCGGPTLETHPASINQQGDIAGYYADDLTGKYHGFVLPAGGTYTSIDPPGGLSIQGTFVYSINDAGAIAGYYRANVPPPGRSHGFVRDPGGSITSFDPPGSISTIALKIDAGGAITGYYNEANLVIHGFVREPSGKITSFDPPGSTSTRPVAINANGIIAGSYSDTNGNHGFVRGLWGTIESFDPPGSIGTTVTAINNAGAITGYYPVANGRIFGFVRRPDGTFERFDVPGTLLTASSINHEGAITGSYSDSSGSHGFVRSPGGTITSFDPPTAQTGCSFSGFSASPTSINQEGVIVGSCHTGFVTNFIAGFERYPTMPGF